MRAILLLLLLSSALASATAAAQEPAVDAAVPVPLDELDRGTPRGSADGFLAAADESDYDTAAEYLDLRNLRGEARNLTGPQLARRLFVIVQRAEWVDVDELVDDPAGRANDGLPDYRDSIGTVLDGGREVRLLMQRIPRDDGIFIWKVSNATVSRIPALYAEYGYHERIESLRKALPSVTILGFELFKWVIAIGAGAAVYAAVFLLGLITRRFIGDPGSEHKRQVFRFLVLPAGLWCVIMTMNAVATSLGRGAVAEEWERISPVPVLITLWLMFSAANLLREIYQARFERLDKPAAAVLLRPSSNALKLLIAISAALFYLDQLGINITTVLAGLGVGGIAVALALQKPMEDIFGAITLYMQQPVRIGDFCRIGDQTGTIEEIGLRTTRIRTLANTVIAIPNARLASEPIDNISARRKILFCTDLRLRYDTTSAQLESVLAGIRDMLGSHDHVLADGQRVRFKEIANDALLVEVFAYVDTTVWTDYLEIAEDLNMRILDIVTGAGTSLSLPAQALHIEQAPAAAS